MELVDGRSIKMPQYSMPLHYEEKVNQELDELLKIEIIKHLSHNFHFHSSQLGKKSQYVRNMCDVRALNRVAVLDKDL